MFKLGTIHNSSNIDGEEQQSQLDKVKKENGSIRPENASIREENNNLMASLERLKAFALGLKSRVTAESL